jgi:hypothetical protein
VFIVAGGTLSGSQTRPVTGVGGTTATRISWSNATATIQPGSPVSMSLQGTWELLGLGGITLASVPLDVIGSGGTTGLTTPFALTLRGYAWTTGFATITGLTNPIGGTPATITTAGSDARTPNGLGTVSWVSPVVINTPLGSETHVLELAVTYVPEPSVWATGGLGVLCLGLYGWLGRRREETADIS